MPCRLGRRASQKRGFRRRPRPSKRWLRSASQFAETLCLCQSWHAIKAPAITIAVPKAANNATIIAIIKVKASVIEIHPILSMRRPTYRSAAAFKIDESKTTIPENG
jgi:hypothetical protein